MTLILNKVFKNEFLWSFNYSDYLTAGSLSGSIWGYIPVEIYR